MVEPTTIGPTPLAERQISLDGIRGLALLGILVINVVSIGLPDAARTHPLTLDVTETADLITWVVGQLLFSQKFMTVFSILFGAGIVLMYNRAEDSGVRLAGAYHRRMLWLLLCGLAHSYLIWSGDILFLYAVCGIVLYPMRRLSSRKLLVSGSIVFISMVLFFLVVVVVAEKVQQRASEAKAATDAGEVLTEEQQKAIDKWEKLQAALVPTQENAEEQTVMYLGGYTQILSTRVTKNFSAQTMSLPLLIWRPLGLMIIGMGLMKIGVLSARLSRRFYLCLTLFGYGIGLIAVGYGVSDLLARGSNPLVSIKYMGVIDYIGSVFVASGHIGIIMLTYKSGHFKAILSRLAAVGRMALSNYLIHTIVFTTVFYGYGFGLYGSIGHFYLMGLVVVMWVLQLLVSPVWLEHFRFGPVEWLWRSLTYWQLQPIRISHTG